MQFSFVCLFFGLGLHLAVLKLLSLLSGIILGDAQEIIRDAGDEHGSAMCKSSTLPVELVYWSGLSMKIFQSFKD